MNGEKERACFAILTSFSVHVSVLQINLKADVEIDMHWIWVQAMCVDSGKSVQD